MAKEQEGLYRPDVAGEGIGEYGRHEEFDLVREMYV